MEIYRIYLRAFITASGKLEVNIQGAEIRDLAAVALAVHDVARGVDPRTVDSLLAAINGMCSEAVTACA